MTTRRYLALSILLVIGVVAVFGVTLRPGSTWDGDSALYVMQARNIAEGTPYRTTQFIANSDNMIHPALYPAGLPLLLAPMYRAFGPDLERMKWVGIVSLGLWLIVFAWIARGFLPDWIALAAAALMALHPYLWKIKDNVWSEFPFMLFTYLTLLLTEKVLERNGSLLRYWPLAIALGLSLAMAYLTRTIGMALFPVVLVTCLWRCRGLQRGIALALVFAVVMIVGAQHWFPSDSGTYMATFDGFTVGVLFETIYAYRWAAYDLVQPQLLRFPSVFWVAVIAYLGLALVGYGSRLRSRVTAYEVFLAAFVGALLVYPGHAEVDRYSLPTWPLLLVYALCGVTVIAGRIQAGRWQRLAPAAMVACLCCSSAYVYRYTDSGPILESVTSPLGKEMFAAVESLVPADAVVLARKPTYIGLFSRRTASTWPEPLDTAHFWEYARKIHATYLLQDYRNFDPAWPDRLTPFVEAHSSRLTTVFRNEWFGLYKMDVPHLTPSNPPQAE